MFGRSGNNLRNVLSRRSSVSTMMSSHSLHTSFVARQTFTPALSHTAMLTRMTHSTATSTSSPTSSSVPTQEQRRYQSTPAAASARQMASPDVNLASQFPDAFSAQSSSSSAQAQTAAAAEYPHHITLVKKVKKDGSPCRKCVEVLARIEREGFMHRIDRIVIADEKNPMSEGMQMAQTFKVKTAPFFLVDSNVDKNEPTQLFTVYFKLKREILAKDLSDEQKLKDIQESPQVQDLVDFI